MATEQKLFTTYRAAVDSFPLGEQKVGLLQPGRYNGYDTMSSVGGSLTIKIKHSGQVVKKTTSLGSAENKFGAVLMPTGIIVHEFKELIFTLAKLSETSGGSDDPRQDVLVCEHNYSETPGGTPATYFIIQGVVGDPEEALPNPTRQIVIGTFLVHGETASSVVYTPTPAPLPGDMTSEVLYAEIREQVIETINENNHETGPGAWSFADMVQRTITQSTTIRPAERKGGRIFAKPGGGTLTVVIPATVKILETKITQLGAGTVKIVSTDPNARFVLTAMADTLGEVNLEGPGATATLVEIIDEEITTYFLQGGITTNS